MYSAVMKGCVARAGLANTQKSRTVLLKMWCAPSLQLNLVSLSLVLYLLIALIPDRKVKCSAKCI